VPMKGSQRYNAL